MHHLKRFVVDDFTRQVGRHDDPGVFSLPPGDHGLIGPESVSWKLHADVASVAVAGIASILMELLHPSVMAGVGQQSNYREQPYRRARTTFGWVVTTTFGNTAAAEQMIARVKRMHSRVNGTRPDGAPYRALDPELIAWVHTCIPWGVMTAYERFNRRLNADEKDRYLAEQSVVGLMSGAEWVPTTAAELDAYFEAMRPKLRVDELTLQFLDFLLTGPLGPLLPRGPLATPVKRFQVEAGVSLMPRWAREMTGLDRPEVVQRLVHQQAMGAYARLLRWAMGTPPWAALASERVAPSGQSAVPAAPRPIAAA